MTKKLVVFCAEKCVVAKKIACQNYCVRYSYILLSISIFTIFCSFLFSKIDSVTDFEKVNFLNKNSSLFLGSKLSCIRNWNVVRWKNWFLLRFFRRNICVPSRLSFWRHRCSIYWQSDSQFFRVFLASVNQQMEHS